MSTAPNPSICGLTKRAIRTLALAAISHSDKKAPSQRGSTLPEVSELHVTVGTKIETYIFLMINFNPMRLLNILFVNSKSARLESSEGKKIL